MNRILTNQNKETEALLAGFTLNLLDSGIEGASRPPKIDSNLQEALFNEIRIRLGLRKNDNSPEALAKIHRLLAEEMSRRALSRAKEQEARARIGDRGDLPASLYDIKFPEIFDQQPFLKAIPRFLIEDSMKAPDSVQHLNPEEFGSTADTQFSLYLKSSTHRVIPEPFYILTTSMRKGYSQTAMGAWILFASELKSAKSLLPLDALRAFVDVYGVTIHINSKSSKFFLYESVPFMVNERTPLIRFEDEKKDFYSSMMVRVNNEKRVVEIAIAYVIDLQKYTETMKRHGFRINS